MPDEMAQVIAHCEEHLMRDKTITGPLTVTEIQGGILKDHLTEEDYLTPHKVISCRILVSHNCLYTNSYNMVYFIAIVSNFC